ncbi:MAG TPA: MauE/DoxX family redox-associated membrane protein [Acidimicrobiia bacterium]
MVQAASAVALALLALAGLAKLMEPEYTSGALRATGLPSGIGIVRLLGMAEFMAGVAGLVLGGPLVAPAAVFYAGFSVFTWQALRRDTPLQSCGCFGREDTPPSTIHLVFDVVATIALAAVAVANLSPLPPGRSIETIVYAGFVGLGTYASVLVLTRLPAVLRLARSS